MDLISIWNGVYTVPESGPSRYLVLCIGLETRVPPYTKYNGKPTRQVRIADKGIFFEAIAVYFSASYWNVPLFSTGFCSVRRPRRREDVLSRKSA